MEHNANQITLRGNLSAPPTFSHENHGKQFYRFFLEVPRLSGVADTLPVIADKPPFWNPLGQTPGECSPSPARSAPTTSAPTGGGI